MTAEEQKIAHKHDVHVPDVTNDEFLKTYKRDHELLLKAREDINFLKCIYGNADYFKENYYRIYFKMNQIDDKLIDEICRKYLEGLCFVLQYYHVSCPSWTWNYTYSMPPTYSDLYAYLKKNETQLHFEFLQEEPFQPLEQMLYVIPRFSLKLLPPKLQEFVQNNKNFDTLFPVEYEMIPQDQVRDYTWKLGVPHVESKTIKSLFAEFDSKKLSKEEVLRNSKGQNKLYQHDKSQKFSLKSSIKGFGDLKDSPIKLTHFDIQKGSLEQFKAKNLDFKSSVSKMPSLKIFKKLKLKEVPCVNSKRRISYRLVLSKTSVKKAYEKFQVKESKAAKERFVEGDIVVHGILNQSFVNVVQKETISKKSENYDAILKSTAEAFKNQNLIFEDKDMFAVLSSFEILSYSTMDFQYLGFQGKKPVLKNIPNDVKQASFIEFSLGPQYPCMKNYEKSVKPSFYQNSILLSLSNGNLYETTEKYSVKTPSQDIKLISPNPKCSQLQTKKVADKQPISNEFLGQLGLSREEVFILWLILDKIEVEISLKEHNSLIMEKYYNMGLNYMRVTNKNQTHWRTDPSHLEIKKVSATEVPYHCPSLESQNEAEQKIMYEIRLSKECREIVLKYFQEMKFLIDFLKEELSQQRLLNKSEIYSKYAQKVFSVNQIYPVNQENKNWLLFQQFLKKVSYQPKPTFLLPFNSRNFSKAEISSLPKLGNQSESTKIESVFEFLKYNMYKSSVWPVMSKQPPVHEIGDRVVITNKFHNFIKFGSLGTVVGVYNNLVEVVFDQQQIGANSLQNRCEEFSGRIVKFWDVFNLTSWKQLMLKQEGKESWDGVFNY